ncbi:hypothetical protein [Azohydromonas caseinilytica]|uniref:Uncharacterized protein n=1 Tax=Azohydromonas caseinilytica TaxID=2728836 RepID=A0A848FBR3_9BURK|nr:hypothetical protein [Azohydromonas caseinilytica]NML17637.1 hypothetical protein [Azohydromonas caseinilytica]
MLNGFRQAPGAALALLALLQWAGSAQASDAPAEAPPSDPPLAAAATAATPPAARPGPLGSKPVAADVLAANRGGTAINDMKLNGVVSGNQASNLATGNNAISDGAFANAAGLPMVVQNSGNNVLIQNATIVNVQLK